MTTQNKVNPEHNGIFKPFASHPDEEFEVKKRTIKSYTELRQVMVKSKNYTKAERKEIAKEMGWKEDVVQDELSVEQHYQGVCKAILAGFAMPEGADIDMSAVERATFFFLNTTK